MSDSSRCRGMPAREREPCAPRKHNARLCNLRSALACSACSGLASQPHVRLTPPLCARGAQARAHGWRACPRAQRTRSRRPRACSTPPATSRPRATALRPPRTPPARGLTCCTTRPCAASAWARWTRPRSSQQARGTRALQRHGPACAALTPAPSAAALAARHAPGLARGVNTPRRPADAADAFADEPGADRDGLAAALNLRAAAELGLGRPAAARAALADVPACAGGAGLDQARSRRPA